MVWQHRWITMSKPLTTEIRTSGQCRGKTFTTRIREYGMESGMYGQEEKKWLTIKGVYLLHPLVH